MNPHVAIVTTSINAKPSVYETWANAGHLIVAGDLNSPPALQDYVEALSPSSTYLTPRQQDHWSFSEKIGWKNIQRRNAAIMLAFASGYDYILTVDDDNYPLPNADAFIAGHITAHQQILIDTVVASGTPFLNTGALCTPQFHARGVPYGMNTTPIVQHVIISPQVVVSQAQVLGDPDCDAVERMCNAPDVKAVTANAIIKPGTYAAFNSQATMWKREWAPVMAVLPHIGRYDDIFASFIFARMARTYNTALYVGEPCMRQVRNEHDLTKDLKAEYWGMSRAIEFCRVLDLAHISADMPLWQAYGELTSAVANVLPRATIDFMNEWVRTWREMAAPQ